jgi:hypothetical protein
MSRHVLSLIAVTLIGCTTTTRLAVAPDQLPGLAGMGPNERREVTPLGHSEPVTVRGDYEIRVNRSLGTIPSTASFAGDEGWTKLDTLRWNPQDVTIGRSGCLREPCTETAPVSDVVSADLKDTRVSPGLTTLAVLGLVAGAAALLVGVAAVIYLNQPALPCHSDWGCPPYHW